MGTGHENRGAVFLGEVVDGDDDVHNERGVWSWQRPEAIVLMQPLRLHAWQQVEHDHHGDLDLVAENALGQREQSLIAQDPVFVHLVENAEIAHMVLV